MNEDEHAAAQSVELRSGPCVWQCAHRLVRKSMRQVDVRKYRASLVTPSTSPLIL